MIRCKALSMGAVSALAILALTFPGCTRKNTDAKPDNTSGARNPNTGTTGQQTKPDVAG